MHILFLKNIKNLGKLRSMYNSMQYNMINDYIVHISIYDVISSVRYSMLFSKINYYNKVLVWLL